MLATFPRELFTQRRKKMDNLVNKFVEVRVEKQLNALSVKFLSFILYQDFVKTLEYEYELIRHYQLKKCIIDLRLIPVYDKGAPEYVKDVWFPTVSSLGMQHVAFVVPEAVLGQMSMTRAHKESESIAGMAVKHFTDVEAAMGWLKTR
jgi:hypothetical protein